MHERSRFALIPAVSLVLAACAGESMRPNEDLPVPAADAATPVDARADALPPAAPERHDARAADVTSWPDDSPTRPPASPDAAADLPSRDTGAAQATDTSPAPSALPAAWRMADIGGPSRTHQVVPADPGGTSFRLQAQTKDSLTGKRQNVPDTALFVHQALDGNGVITAKITARATTFHQWGGAGLMIRASTAPLAVHFALVGKLHAGHAYPQIYFRREVSPDAAFGKQGPERGLPLWLRIERAGNRLTGLASSDGMNWAVIDALDLPLPRMVEVGLTLWDEYNEAWAVFEDVRITRAP